MRKFYLNANVPSVEISPHYAHRKLVKRRAVFYGANAAGVNLAAEPWVIGSGPASGHGLGCSLPNDPI